MGTLSKKSAAPIKLSLFSIFNIPVRLDKADEFIQVDMTIDELKKSVEMLEKDFKNIPDRAKDFPALQDRLEVLLRQTLELSEPQRETLMPLFKKFQNYLKEHLEEVQKQAAILQVDLQERKTHKQAVAAYNKFKTP